jgi:hypothetical protein
MKWIVQPTSDLDMCVPAHQHRPEHNPPLFAVNMGDMSSTRPLSCSINLLNGCVFVVVILHVRRFELSISVVLATVERSPYPFRHIRRLARFKLRG